MNDFIRCIYCGAVKNVKKYGLTKANKFGQRKQRYFCNICCKQFTTGFIVDKKKVNPQPVHTLKISEMKRTVES